MTKNWRGVATLAFGVLMAGTAWPMMKFALAEATPIWFATVRAMLSASSAFVLLAVLGKLRVPRRADLPIILSIGCLQLCAFFVFTHLGLSLLPAGRSAVLAYSTTLWVVPLAGPLLGEWPRGMQLLGVAIGLAGVAVLLVPAAGAFSGSVAGHVYLLLAALVWALAILHSRGHRWSLTPLQLVPWQMLLASVLLVIIALVVEPDGRIPLTMQVLAPLAYVGLIAGIGITWAGTSSASLLPAAASSLGFLAVPVLGVAISSLWLGEELTLDFLAGGLMILAGAALAIMAANRAAR